MTIIGAESASRDVTFYIIQVSLDNGDAWKVARRYSQFKDLHDRFRELDNIMIFRIFQDFITTGLLRMSESLKGLLISQPGLTCCPSLMSQIDVHVFDW